jgi:hypothetical protein
MTLDGVIKEMRIGISLPQPDWQIVDGSGDGPDRTLMLSRGSPIREMVVLAGEPAKRRTLQAFVHDAGYRPDQGHAVRICKETQAAWYVDQKPATAGEFTGFAVLAVNAKRAIAVAYMHRAPEPEDPATRNAVLDACML